MPAKSKTMRRVSRDQHNRCMTAATRHRAKLTEAEIVTLNVVAVGWAINEPVHYRHINDATAILERIGE